MSNTVAGRRQFDNSQECIAKKRQRRRHANENTLEQNASIYLIIRRCARTGAFPGAFCVPNSVALASPTLWGVQWAIN